MISSSEKHVRHTLNDVSVSSYLTLERVQVGLQVSSKKRLLERMVQLLMEGNPLLDRKTVVQVLSERERLGSTGIGNGVALPHGRVSGLDRPIGAFAVLDGSIDFDALDKKNVKLVFGLLVPADCTEEHLQILAHLARMFSDDSLRGKLERSRSCQQAYDLIVNWSAQSDTQ